MSDLFIVDNGDKNWKAKDYLHEWADLAHTFDVAAGYFEIVALLKKERIGDWTLQRLTGRMGDEQCSDGSGDLRRKALANPRLPARLRMGRAELE